MKVLFVNKTFQSGGAAIAARQIANAVKKQGIELSFLVQEEPIESIPNVYSTCNGFSGKIKQYFLFIKERLQFLKYEKSKELRYVFSPAFSGEDISTNDLVKDCDIVHIHWFNQGFISLGYLKKLVQLGKPIVWTLHDMWAFTGGCHYAWDCNNFQKTCGDCVFLARPSENDLSSKIWKEKHGFYSDGNMHFVPVSKWLGRVAGNSSLGKSIPQKVIYNPIDTTVFRPSDREGARKRYGLDSNDFYVLFGASRIDDKIKGLPYLIEAVKKLGANVKIVIFGGEPKFDKDILDRFSVEVKYIGSVAKKDQSMVYSMCDVTCVPSDYETFGLVAAESMACQTPVVAFDNSGVSEVVNHYENGYLAKYKSTDDLANGIDWILNHDDRKDLGVKAREKIIREFSEEKIGESYVEWYNEVMTSKTKGNE